MSAPAENHGDGGGREAMPDECNATSVDLGTFPAPRSVKGRVLADLLIGRHITPGDCWREHGSSHCPHHVMMLRRAGWPIITDERLVGTSDGRQALIAYYHLPDDTIAAMDDAGAQFLAAVAAAQEARK